MTTKTENLSPVQPSQANEADAPRPAGKVAGKRPFVEPQVTFPIDVLEATTFFALTDSGSVPTPPVPVP